MFLLVLGVIALVIAIGVYLFGRIFDDSTEERVDKDAKMVRKAALIPFAIFLLLEIAGSIKVVPANSVGIPVSFGSIGSPKSSGLHIMAPWTEIHTFSTRLQESSMLGDPKDGDRSTDDAVDVRGSDDGVVYMDITVRYTITEDTASALFKRTGSMEGIRDRIIRPDTRSIARDIAKNYAATDLVAAQRSTVEKLVTESLAARMSSLYGIKIDAVLLRGVRPSDQVEKAIQAKIAAQQGVEQALIQQQKDSTDAQTRQKVAALDAEATKTKAQATADAQRIQAQGEADANAKVAASLTPEILRQQQIEALKAGTVYVVPDGGNFILGDLTKAAK